jgi:Inorganic pyrophosphatase
MSQPTDHSMRVFIENEAGSRRKHVYDPRTLAHLATADVSAAYPYPYGFVLGTCGGDGDAVDCFVLTATRLASGSVVDCEPVGLPRADRGRRHRPQGAGGAARHRRGARQGGGGAAAGLHLSHVRARAWQANGARLPPWAAGCRRLRAEVPRPGAKLGRAPHASRRFVGWGSPGLEPGAVTTTGLAAGTTTCAPTRSMVRTARKSAPLRTLRHRRAGLRDRASSDARSLHPGYGTVSFSSD